MVAGPGVANEAELVARVLKRLRAHFAFLRKFIGHMQRDHQAFYFAFPNLPNPCIATMSKRTWERIMLRQRLRLRASLEGNNRNSNVTNILLLHVDSVAVYCGYSVASPWSVSSSFQTERLWTGEAKMHWEGVLLQWFPH